MAIKWQHFLPFMSPWVIFFNEWKKMFNVSPVFFLCCHTPSDFIMALKYFPGIAISTHDGVLRGLGIRVNIHIED